MKVDVSGRAVEWSDDEAYAHAASRWRCVAARRSERGRDRIRIDRSRLISYINDLHKGRNTGGAWSLFLDVFAVGCLVFCITGLLILKMHSERRPPTWPMQGLGLVIPALLALLLIH